MYLDCWRVRILPSGATGTAFVFTETLSTGRQVDMLKVAMDGTGSRCAPEVSGFEYRPDVPIENQICKVLNPRFTLANLEISKTTLQSGQYHPRIWRQQDPINLRYHYRREFALTIQAIGNLFSHGADVYRYIEPSTATREAFGHRIREVLILACTEVEAAWKAILVANQKATTTDRLSTKEYVTLLPVLRLNEWEIKLANYPDYPPFKPFGGWSAAAQTQSLTWYHAYNSVKHDREFNFSMAKFEHMIMALGACYVMLRAQFGDPSMYAHDSHYPVPFISIGEPRWALAEQYVPAYPMLPEDGFTWTPTPF